jgi:hypothetical protein
MAAMATLRREFCVGKPKGIREYFTCGNRAARGPRALWSHEFRWELALDVNSVVLRTQVTRKATDI